MPIRVTNSLEFWKSTPTTAAVMFGIEMPYRPPKSPLGAFLWRRRVWLETTTGLSLLEPWEKVLILFVFYLMLTITITGLYKYLPQQVDMLTQRMVYYIFGHEADKALHTQRLMAGVVGMNATREL